MVRFIVLLISVLAPGLVVHGASVKGKVTDAQTGEQLVGATIYIREAGKGTTTGFDGTFIIKDVQSGFYTLEVSFISYEPAQLRLSLKGTETAEVSIALMPISNEIEQVVVTAQGSRATEVGAKISEQKAIQLINVVSARTIELSPDLNIANVVQRMSGVTLDKHSSSTGQYALLRGMDKRYNYTLINGIKIPSTHNKHRYVSLELFPSDMVERVEVTKALTPDFEGDAIGGVVNMVMKSAPERFFLQASASAGYSQYFTTTPFISFNSRALNPKSPYERFGKGYYAKPDDFSTSNLVLRSSSFPVNRVGTLTLGNRFFQNKLGAIVSASYQNTYGAENSLYFSDDLSRDGKNLPLLKDMQERIFYDDKRNLGLHGNIDYLLSRNNRLKLYLAYISLDKVQVREVQKTDLTVSYDPENGNVTRTHSTRLRFNSQSLLNATLQGEHGITSNLRVQWSAVYSVAKNRTPEEATIIYGNSLSNFVPVQQYVDFDGSSRIWRRNVDNDKAAYINFFYTPSFAGRRVSFQFGGMYRDKERTSFYNKYTLKAIVRVSTPDTAYVSFYSEKGVDWATYDQIVWQVYNPRGTIAVGENYDASEEVLAGYAMFRAEFGKLQVTSGARVEHTSQGYYMQYPIGEPNPVGSSNYLEVLPSVHLKYSPSSKQNIRFSYYKAINKPGFQEIVPYIDASDEPTSAGNKNLKHATADNIDFRVEHFPEGLDQFMVGVFYKRLINPIEFAFDKYMNVSQNIVYTPVNTDKAINYGLEVDVVKFYREWGIRANYTRTQSSITTNKLSRVKDSNGNDSTAYVKQTRPLFGQSANVGNISLLYRSANRGINLQVAFSYTGDRIFTVSRFIDNDLWQQGFWQLDISAEKNFKNKLGIYAKALNLLNTHTKVYIKKVNPINNDVPYHGENDKNTLVRDDYSMPSFLLGVRYKF